MTKQSKYGMLLAIIAVLTLSAPGAAQSQSELGVARVSLTNGEVSTRHGDSGDWVEGRVNLPLVEGDSIATGAASRAEVQLDSTNFVRLNESTELSVAELGNRQFRVQVAHGIVTYSELKGGEADVDIETPHVAVRPLKHGNYRVEVTAAGETIVTVRSGEAEVASREGRETLKSGRSMIVRGAAEEAEFQLAKAARRDDWDHWNERRDKQLSQSVSRRYVSSDIYGVEDLDDHGSWRHVSGYGDTWFPTASAGWAPYRHGRWTYLDYYGWSWVGYEPWGWAPYHYGRWYQHASYGWGWYPGHRYGRHHWRPALVAFFGYNSYSGFSAGLNFGFGNIGWVPLAPYETYYPWYGGHRGYGRGGVNNTTINIDNSTNIYTNYRNARAHNGVSLVDAESFSRGRVNAPRSLRAAELRRATLMRGQIPVVPARQSQGRVVRASNRSAGAGTANSVRRSGFFSRQPSRQRATRTSFDQQRQNVTRSVRAFSDSNGRRTATAGAAAGTGRGVRAGGAGSTAGAASARSSGGVRGGAGVRAGTSGSRSAPLSGPGGSNSVSAGGTRRTARTGNNPSRSGSTAGDGAVARGGVRTSAGAATSRAETGRGRVRASGQSGSPNAVRSAAQPASGASGTAAQTPRFQRFGRSRTGAAAATGNSGRVLRSSGQAGARGGDRVSRSSPSPAQSSRPSWRRFGGNSRIGSSTARSRTSQSRVSGGTRAGSTRLPSTRAPSTQAHRNGNRSGSFTLPRPAQGGGNRTSSGVVPRTRSRVGTNSGSRGYSSPRTFSLPRPVEGNSARRGGGFVPRSRSRAAQPSRSGVDRSGSISRSGASSGGGGNRTFAPRSNSRVSIPRASRSGGSRSSAPPSVRRSIPRSRPVQSRAAPSRGGSSRVRPSAGGSRSFGGFGGGSQARSAPSPRSSGGFGRSSSGRAPSVRSGGGARSAPSRSPGSVSRGGGGSRASGGSWSSGRGNSGRR